MDTGQIKIGNKTICRIFQEILDYFNKIQEVLWEKFWPLILGTFLVVINILGGTVISLYNLPITKEIKKGSSVFISEDNLYRLYQLSGGILVILIFIMVFYISINVVFDKKNKRSLADNIVIFLLKFISVLSYGFIIFAFLKMMKGTNFFVRRNLDLPVSNSNSHNNFLSIFIFLYNNSFILTVLLILMSQVIIISLYIYKSK